MPSILVHSPTGDQTYALKKRITSVGCGAANDVVVDAPDVDETHAMIQLNGESFVIQNLSTTTPIRVNGRVERRAELSDGDSIELGGSQMTFQLFERVVAPSRGVERARERSYQDIVRFAQRLLSTATLPELLRELIDSVILLTDADRGFLILSDPADGLQVAIARNVEADEITDGAGNFSDSIVQRVIETRKPLIVSDALSDASFGNSQSVVSLKLCSVLCVPLLHGDELAGLIYVGNNNVVSLFTDAHLEAITVYAGFASLALRNQLVTDALRERTRALEEEVAARSFGALIGACDAMQQVYTRVERVAPTDVSVLVRGETGTGKELIARELHLRSNRAAGPFVAVNCGAIPANLLESELFGHVRGAFTGASADRIGRFQAANGGTLFLDELGELPSELQVKLLRVLQERVVTPVGANRARPVDVRVVSATNVDLLQAIEAGTFREDLYYRLNVIEIELPPLRERGDDVLLLAEYFVQRASEDLGVGTKKTLTRDARQALSAAAWPGNIRQLENHIRKALILSSGPALRARDLDLRSDELRPLVPLQDARNAWQERYVRDALTRFAGNKAQTAEALGVDPRTLYRYLVADPE